MRNIACNVRVKYLGTMISYLGRASTIVCLGGGGETAGCTG